MTELQSKQQKLNAFLDRHKLDGVLLTLRNNFAWITCGRDNRIANVSPIGVASILATREKRICLANTIEAPRMRAEELAAEGIEVVSFPWWDKWAAAKIAGDIIAEQRIAADAVDFGLKLTPLPEDFAELRWSLSEPEIARYRFAAKRTSAALERVCRELRPGVNEHEIAGMIDHYVHQSGCNPTVTLVASDERVTNYRHPIPIDKKMQRYAMLVCCSEYGGLISNLTRFVHFGPISSELQAKQQAICNVDAAINLSTRPGKTLGELFAVLQKAYADNGQAGQWQLHHQGGPTGYAGREVIATPDADATVRENQAFAWNPSIVGAKSEDTTLVTPNGMEILTAHSNDWPTITGKFGDQTMRRADILVI